MMQDELEEILKEADLVLVGIGEEFSGTDELRLNKAYGKLCREAAEGGAQWMVPYINRRFLSENEKFKRAYGNLGTLLQNKNYFVITTCMDGLIELAGLKEDRITTPCGSFNRLQCTEGCAGSVVPAKDTFFKELDAVYGREKTWDAMELPTCKSCGAPMECNTLYAEHYLEEGYMDSWGTYMKWLQGTLNRRLCILELGSDMMFAGVLRFRFEKMISLNQKAKLIRIHSRLHQLPAEIAGQGMGISKNAVDFMAEL